MMNVETPIAGRSFVHRLYDATPSPVLVEPTWPLWIDFPYKAALFITFAVNE